jgi:hypothetical protein
MSKTLASDVTAAGRKPSLGQPSTPLIAFILWDLLLTAAWFVMRERICVPPVGTLEHFLAFDAPQPFAARLLVPILANALEVVTGLSGRQSIYLIDALGFLALLSGIRYALRPLVSPPVALLSSLAIPLMMGPAIFLSPQNPPIFFPYDMTSVAFIAWGFGFILRRKAMALILLLPFATLNRETAILLPIAWFLLWWDRLPTVMFLKTTALISLAFVVPRAVALFLTRHQPTPYGSSLPLTEPGGWIIDGNIGWLLSPSNIVLSITFLGFVPLLLPYLYKNLPDASRRMLLVLVIQLFALLFCGKIDEARIYAEWIVIAGIILAPAVAVACGAPDLMSSDLKEPPREGLANLSCLTAKYAPAALFLCASAAYVFLHLWFPLGS